MTSFSQGSPCITSFSQGSPCMNLFSQEGPCINLAGLLSPRPRFLSSRKERNQRFAKEEVSSLETPLRGFSPRELREAKFSPPVCSASRRMSGVAPAASGSKWVCRAYLLPLQWGIKGACPLREVFQTSEVKEPDGSLCALCETFFTQESFRGCGPRRPTNRVCRDCPAKNLAESSEKELCSFSCLRRQKDDFAGCTSAGMSCPPSPYKKVRPFVRADFSVWCIRFSL